MTWEYPEDLLRPGQSTFIRDLVWCCVSSCIPEDPEEKKVITTIAATQTANQKTYGDTLQIQIRAGNIVIPYYDNMSSHYFLFINNIVILLMY